MSEPRCDRCKWFYDCNEGDEGECRRYPPVVVTKRESEGGFPFHNCFPMTMPDDWCGEFTPKEEAKT